MFLRISYTSYKFEFDIYCFIFFIINNLHVVEVCYYRVSHERPITDGNIILRGIV